MDPKKDILSLRGRIQYALSNHDLTIYKLANGETDQTKLRRQINGTTMISSETIELILEKLPAVSAEWLLRGEGRMYRADHAGTHVYNNVHTDGAPAAVSGTGDVSTYGDSSHVTVNELIRAKDETIASKDSELASKDKTIHTLELLLASFQKKP